MAHKIIMPTIPEPYTNDELMRLLRLYGRVSFYCNSDEMNMCRVLGESATSVAYDYAFGGYRGSDIDAAKTSYQQLYLTVMSNVWQIEDGR